MQRAALIPLVSALLLSFGASPSFAASPPDEIAPDAVLPPETSLQLDLPRAPATRHAIHVRETVLALVQSPAATDATRVIAVVAQGAFATGDASKIETFVADLLVKERRAIATLRGVAEFSLDPSAEKTPEALARITSGHGAVDLVVIRPIRHATVGPAQPQRILVQVLNGATVVASRAANASALLSPVIDTAPSFELPETPISRAGMKREGPSLKVVRAFKRRAIRITPRRFFAGWDRPSATNGFRMYGPAGVPLKREQVLRTVGREDLAKQIETLDELLPWTVAGVIAGSIGVVLAGTITGAVGLGFVIPSPTGPVVPVLGGLLGLSTGVLVSLPLAATLALVPFVFETDDDEVVESIRTYNLSIATDVGLQVDDVPFYYLGL